MTSLDQTGRRLRQQLDDDAVDGRWEWLRDVTDRLGVLETRSKWALRIASGVVSLVGALGIYARDNIASALEKRGEERVRAAVLAEDRARSFQQGVELQLLRIEIADLRGRFEGFSVSRGHAPRLTPDPKDDTP